MLPLHFLPTLLKFFLFFFVTLIHTFIPSELTLISPPKVTKPLLRNYFIPSLSHQHVETARQSVFFFLYMYPFLPNSLPLLCISQISPSPPFPSLTLVCLLYSFIYFFHPLSPQPIQHHIMYDNSWVVIDSSHGIIQMILLVKHNYRLWFLFCENTYFTDCNPAGPVPSRSSSTCPQCYWYSKLQRKNIKSS